MNTPTIRVKKDVEADTQEFIKFLYRWSPEKKNLIVRTYPELADAAQLDESVGGKIVSDFIQEYYVHHQKEIDMLVSDMESQVKTAAEPVISALGEVMEYSWNNKDNGYTVIPTLLPFSPLHEPIFFFSLVRFLREHATSVASSYGLTAVIAHEVSHFIFFDLLKKEDDAVRAKCNKTIEYFAKEILAPVVMNDERLNIILKLSDYGGNPLLKYIAVQEDGKEQNIVEFFREKNVQQKLTKTPFIIYVSYLIETLSSIEHELRERFDTWNMHGNALLSNAELKTQYCKPIDIKNRGGTSCYLNHPTITTH